jgi:hypothetical protein
VAAISRLLICPLSTGAPNVFEEMVATDVARVLAELVDTALADEWGEQEPVMALLWQASDDPDDLRVAVKRLDGSIDGELAALPGGSYLAVAHSVVTRRLPAELLPCSAIAPVRITVAVDHESDSGVLRHRNGTTEWFGAVELPVTTLIRSLLWLELDRASLPPS